MLWRSTRRSCQMRRHKTTTISRKSSGYMTLPRPTAATAEAKPTWPMSSGYLFLHCARTTGTIISVHARLLLLYCRSSVGDNFSSSGAAVESTKCRQSVAGGEQCSHSFFPTFFLDHHALSQYHRRRPSPPATQVTLDCVASARPQHLKPTPVVS